MLAVCRVAGCAMFVVWFQFQRRRFQLSFRPMANISIISQTYGRPNSNSTSDPTPNFQPNQPTNTIPYQVAIPLPFLPDKHCRLDGPDPTTRRPSLTALTLADRGPWPTDKPLSASILGPLCASILGPLCASILVPVKEAHQKIFWGWGFFSFNRCKAKKLALSIPGLLTKKYFISLPGPLTYNANVTCPVLQRDHQNN